MPYLDDLKTFRERAGIRISELASEAEVDRGTVIRAEKHDNCRKETLVKLVNALNILFYKKNGSLLLDSSKIISERSKYGN